MRIPAVLFVAVLFATCCIAQVPNPQSRAESSGLRTTQESQKASADSVVDFLLTSAANDFHAHGPDHIVGFRDVRVGRITEGGEARIMLCGRFLRAQDSAMAEGVPFVTIKTSGYEQYLGPQALSFCQGASVVWEITDDLSSLLKRRLDALQK